MATKRFPAKLTELDAMIAHVSAQAKSVGFSESELSKIELVAEESLVNVIKYGFPNRDDGDVEVTCDGERNSWFVLTVRDDGVPFDPTKYDTQIDAELPVNQRKVGGYGVYLIHQVMDEVSYRREEGRNILTMKKRLT